MQEEKLKYGGDHMLDYSDKEPEEPGGGLKISHFDCGHFGPDCIDLGDCFL
jgi:hypothetical protein